MSKKHYGIMEELDLHDVEGYTEAQKSYYVSLGYRPYRSNAGKIKWLSPDLHSRRINQFKRRHFLHYLFRASPRQAFNRRKHRSQWLKFLLHNWFFILLVLWITLLVLYFLYNPSILVRS